MLVMHIGPHKTATTYIQHNFHEARAALKARGWTYPEFGAKGLPGHHDLAHNAMCYVGEDAEKGAELAELGCTARAGGQNLVFSAEGFCRWAQPKLDGFADRIGADQLDLVYVVRDPLDVFYSYWAEEVKQGRSASLPERFSEHFSDPFKSRLLNPLVDLRKLVRLDNIRLHIVPFEVLRSRNIDIFEHICDSVLDLPDIKAASSRPKNISFPSELTEFLRLMTLIEGTGARRLPDGAAMRLRFTNVIMQKDRTEIVNLIRSVASDARREIKFSSNLFYKRRLARLLKTDLDGLWTLPFEEDELFLYDAEKIYTHYDSYALMQHPEIMDAVQDVMARITVPPRIYPSRA